MVKLLVLIILGVLVYRTARRYMSLGQKKEQGPVEGSVDEMVQDPSCRTYIPRRGAQRKVLSGREFFFCSKECADKFQKEMREQA